MKIFHPIVYIFCTFYVLQECVVMHVISSKVPTFFISFCIDRMRSVLYTAKTKYVLVINMYFLFLVEGQRLNLMYIYGNIFICSLRP